MPRKRGSGRVGKTVNSSANTVSDVSKRGGGRGRRGRPPLNAKANRMEASTIGDPRVEGNCQAPIVVPVLNLMVARTISESDPGDSSGYLHKKFKKVAAPVQNDAVVEDRPASTASSTALASQPEPEVTETCKRSAEESVPVMATEEESDLSKKSTGKYVCPICQHACAKPSVLEKHLRAHTNERPYPCTSCGFAFKTKSNLYKHCKSRAHALKLESLGQAGTAPTDICFSGPEDGASDEEDSMGEDLATLSDASSTSQLSQSQNHNQNAGQHTPFKHSVASMLNNPTEATPPKANTAPEVATKDLRTNSVPDSSIKVPTPDKRLYKPKFRGVGSDSTLDNAVVTCAPALPSTVPANDTDNLSSGSWAGLAPSSSFSTSTSLSLATPSAALASPSSLIARSLPSPGSLQARISQIISDNEAIVETRDPLWAKRFMRQTSKDKNSSKALVLIPTTAVVCTSPMSMNDSAKHLRERSLSFSVARLEESRGSPVIQYSGKSAPVTLGLNSVNILSVTEDLHRKRCHSEGPVASQNALLCASASPAKSARYENRPESYPGADLSGAIMVASGTTYSPKPSQGSIIKDLLLMNRPSRLSRDEPDQNSRVTSAAPVSNYADYQKYYRSAISSSESEGGALNLSISRLPALPPRPPSGQGHNSNMSPGPMHEHRNSNLIASLGSSWSLRAHEEQSQALNSMLPSKSSSLQLFGGQVQICDGDEKRILRIDASGVTPDDKSGEMRISYDAPSTLLVSIANSGLNSGGGIVQVQEKVVVRSSAGGPMGSVGKSPFSSASSRNFFLPATSFDPSLSIIPVTKVASHPPEVPGIPGPASQVGIPEITIQSPPPATSSNDRDPIAYLTLSYPTCTTTTTFSEAGTKFLRPNSLPLKPGTFLPRKISMTGMDHLGTPNLSGPGMTLVSPETPRPRKSYGQTYLNGHAYTYLGLKCSTRVYYCCLSRPQPMYVLQSCDQKLSMYSQWQTRPIPAEASPCGLGPAQVMSLYDSRHRSRSTTVAQSNAPTPLLLTHSSYWLHRDRASRSSEDGSDARNLIAGVAGNSQVPLFNSADLSTNLLTNSVEAVVKKEEDAHEKPGDAGESRSVLPKRVRIFAGGFKSNEDYTYVRGRGRGRYVCEECGIRCKKPSMLKKHIRTHTDVRPYTCRQCCFSFKTKGNLTKHMKSKAHHKKCTDLGIVPVPTAVEDCNIDEESVAKQESLRKLKAQLGEGDSDVDMDEEEEDEDEEEDEEDDEEEDQFEDADETEREVAHSLLDLQSACNVPDALRNAKAAADAGLIAPLSIKPNTYPYVGGPELSQAFKDSVSHAKDSVMVCSSASISRYYFPAKTPRVDETTTLTTTMAQGNSETAMTSSLPSPSVPSIVSSTGAPAVIATVTTFPSATTGQSDMLQMYLTEKACKEVEVKRKHWKESLLQVETNLEQPGVVEHSPIHLKAPSLVMPVTLSNPNSSSSTVTASSILMPFPKVEITHNEAFSSNAMEVCEEMQVPTDMMRAQTSVPLVIAEGTSGKPRAEFLLPSSAAMAPSAYRVTDDGKTACSICNKVFSKPSQLRLHINIHYFERPFRCDACAVSFRTKGHLQKHKRSVSHFNKVNMNLTFGTPSTENPRPFKCSDCLIAFRIHGHLAKHLRSKMHIMKLECLGKLPFGTYAEMERSGMNLNEIDTTDCQNSLESLQSLAQRLYRQDPSKLQQWQAEVQRSRTVSGSSEDLDEVDDVDADAEVEDGEDSDGAPCPEPLPDPCPDIERSLEHRSKVWPANHSISRESEDKTTTLASKTVQYALDHANGFSNSRSLSVTAVTYSTTVTTSSSVRSNTVENHLQQRPGTAGSRVSVTPINSGVIRGPLAEGPSNYYHEPSRSHCALEIRQLPSKLRYEYPPDMDKASACLCSACGEVCANNEAFRTHVLQKHPPQSVASSSSNSTNTSSIVSQANTPSAPQSLISSANYAPPSTSGSTSTTSVTTLWNPLTHKPSKPLDSRYPSYQRSENSQVRLSLDFPTPTSFSLNLPRVSSQMSYAELNPAWVKEQQTMLAYMASRAGTAARNESFPSVSMVTSASCDLCGKQGMNSMELKQHLSSHAQPRPFVCEFCDAGFTTRQSLENHILFHKRQSLS